MSITSIKNQVFLTEIALLTLLLLFINCLRLNMLLYTQYFFFIMEKL